MEAWYAIFVKTGQESKVKERLDYRFHDTPSVFVPKREILERKEGRWHRRIKVLFPGYIFLKGEMNATVLSGLYQVPGLFKLLCTDRLPMVIPKAEVEVFIHLLDENDTIGLSDVWMEGDKISISSGPLLSMQGEIMSVDKRKGRARVKLIFLGEERLVDLGLNMMTAAVPSSGDDAPAH